MTEAVEPVALEAMVDPEVVQQIRGLRAQGWGAKRIARELEIARNTVKRYLRGGDAALVQSRPQARALDDAQRERAVALFDEVAEGNAVVVHRELVREGTGACVRTVQRWSRIAGARIALLRSRRCATRRRPASRCRSTSARRKSGSAPRW